MTEDTTIKKSPLSNKVYDTLKIIAAILPILGTAIFGLSEIWKFPYGAEIQATLSILASTLSAILIKLSHDYTKMQQALVEHQAIKLPEPEIINLNDVGNVKEEEKSESDESTDNIDEEVIEE